jgi:hypothetical protein
VERVLKEGIAELQKSYKLRFALSDFYLRTNRSDQSITLLKEALAIDKDSEKPEAIDAKNRLQTSTSRGGRSTTQKDT